MVSEERIKTNLLLTDYLDYWDELSVKSINDEWTLRYYNHIMNLLNSQVDEAVKWLESDDAKELFFEEAEYQHELFRALEDQWDEILENKYPSVEALVDEVYRRGKAKGYAEMREHIRFTDTDKLALEFVREYNFALIRKLDNDTRDHIRNIITSAVVGGENPRKVAPKIMDTVGTRLAGSTFTPAQRAVMIARTEISRVQNTGILQSYVNEGYTEVKILTAEDSNVCYTCLTYAYEFNKDTPVIFENRGKEKVHNIKELIKGEMFPPFHPNCRCTYLSIWKSKGEPSENPHIINLTSWKFYDFPSLNNEKIPFKKLSKNKIPSDWPNLIKEELLNFDNYYQIKYSEGKRIEYGYIANLTTGDVSEYVKGVENRINFNDVKLTIYEEDELIATHSHSHRNPFNYLDFSEALKSPNLKYMVVHTPQDIFIAEFNEMAYENKDKIIEKSEEDFVNMMARNMKFQSDALGAEMLWENYLKNKLLNKYITFRRISK